MANVSVSFSDYIFTATVYTDNSPTITDGNWTVTVYSTSSNSVSITNTTSNVEIVDNGIMTIQAASTASIDEFTGNSIQTTFTLTEEVMGDEYVEVSVGGVIQNPGVGDAYRVRTVNTGSESAVSYIDFSEAPPSGTNVLAQYFSVRTAFDIQGPQGIPGPYTTINVGSVSTSTSTVSVSTTGTTGTKYLNFVLPYVVGPRGATGAQGPGASNLSWYTLPYTRGVDGPTEIRLGKNSGGTFFGDTGDDPYGYNGSISIGEDSGYQYQSTSSIAIGYRAGYYQQGGPASIPYASQSPAVAIGSEAGYYNQGDGAVALGRFAGNTNQAEAAVAIGRRAGTDTQGSNSIALGAYAAEFRQGILAVTVGNRAGQYDQGDNSIAIGYQSGRTNQGNESVAIGNWAGTSTQGFAAVALGRLAGENAQGTRTVAIGNRAGEFTQGDFSVAIGGTAGQTNQHANTIVLNAQGVLPSGSTPLNTDRTNAFFVKPIRHVTGGSKPVGFYNMAYNPTTGEIIYWS